MKKSNYILISLLLLVGMYCAASVSYALDAPHNTTSDVDCDLCHYQPDSIPGWTSVPFSAETTPFNALCVTCHNTVDMTDPKFADVKTHSSFETGPTGSYSYIMECRTCHNPHLQDNLKANTALGNLETGLTTGVTLSTTSTLSDSSKNWPTDKFKNAILIPNTTYPTYFYRITGNTSNTLTVRGLLKNPPYAGVGKTYSIKYGKLVKTSISTPSSGSKAVTFLTNSGPYSYVTTTVSIKGICQVCHTKTLYYRGDGSKVQEGHYGAIGDDCVSCHKHNVGFKGVFAAGGGCAACHGNPPSDGLTLISKNAVNGDPVTSDSPGAGVHLNHTTKSIGCDNCHLGGMNINQAGASVGNYRIDLGFSLQTVTIPGNYDGKWRSFYSYKNYGLTTVTTGNSLNCTNLYCHSNVQTGANGTGAPTTSTVKWTSASTGQCGTCHAGDGASGNATLIATGSHTKHVNAGTYNFSCSQCHNNAGSGRANHVDNNIQVSFLQGGAYSQPTNTPGNGYGTCSTSYCHSTGQAALGATVTDYATPQWGTTVTCGSCHKDFSSDATAPGSHPKHVISGGVACATCHSGYTAGTVAAATHANGNVNLSFAGPGAGTTYSQGSSHLVGNGYGSCSTAPCHNSGQAPDGTASPLTYGTPTWGLILGCNSCHKDMNSDPTAPGSHPKHVQSYGMSCAICHNGYTSNSVASASHIDTQVTLSFTGLGVWTSYSQGNSHALQNGYGSCSAGYCHGKTNTSPAWGSTTSCVSCHDASSTGLSLRHDKHYNSATAAQWLTGGTDAHTPDAYVYACLQCHPTNSHTTGSWNSMADAQLTGAKMSWYTVGAANTNDAKGFKYSLTGNCGTTCHTKDGSTIGSAISAPNWGSASTGSCGVCHNKPADAAPVWSTAHSKHLKVYSANTNITCNACHSGTASSMTTINTAAGRNQHPDGTKNVAFNAWSSGAGAAWSGTQCSNTYCHSNGTSPNGGTHAAVAWNTITTCGSCHGSQVTWTTSGATAATGVHYHHIADSGFACNICHSATASSMTTIGTYANHVDKNVTIRINNSYSTVGSTYSGVAAAWNTIYQKTPGTATGTCNTTFCHGVSSPNWGTVSNDAQCVKCHGVVGTTPAEFTADKRTAAPGWNTTGRNTAGAVGTQTNGVSNDSKVGAHNKHLNAYSVWGTIGYSSDVACADCHTLWSSVGSVGHMNGSTDMVWSSFARNAGTDWTAVTGALTPNYANGTCATVYCHGNGFWSSNRGAGITVGWTSNAYLTSARWTTVGCNQCHLSPPNVKHNGLDAHPAAELGSCTPCHGHDGWGTSHINGTLEASGACNSCHWYDTTDAGAWSVAKTGADTTLWNSANAWGAHSKHIDHLKARYGVWLTASTNQWGTVGIQPAYAQVCGFCHGTDAAREHQLDGGSATRNIWATTSIRTTHAFGASLPSWDTVTRSCSNLDCHYKGAPIW